MSSTQFPGTEPPSEQAAETRARRVAPIDRLEVQPSRLTAVLFVLLGLFFVPMGLALLIDGLRGGPTQSIIIGLACLSLYGAVVWIGRRGRVNSVRSFTAEGLVRGDGRTFEWTDLSGVVNQVMIRQGRQSLWRIEIHFAGGESAWLIPTKIRNYDEVVAFVRTMPCEHTEVRV